MSFASWLRTLRARFRLHPEHRSRPTRRKRRTRTPLALEALEDRTVPSTFTVTTTADSGPGSLRQAILDANAANTGTATNPDLIQFKLAANDPNHFYYKDNGGPGISLADIAVTTVDDTGLTPAQVQAAIPGIDPDYLHTWYTITPASLLPGTPATPLPLIQDTLVLDGYTQRGASANRLRGAGQLGVAPGDPSLYGDNAVLKVMLDCKNLSSLPGGAWGVGVVGNYSTIRGLAVNAGQTGGAQFGSIEIGDGVTGNVVQGNFLGTDVSGTVAEGGEAGITDGGNGTVIGWTTPDARNIISANTVGIDLFGAQGVVEGNFIGTDASGTAALGNTDVGIREQSQFTNTIGGAAAGAGNLISGNHNIGVTLGGPANQLGGLQDVMQGNLVGTDVTGTKPLGNGVGVFAYFGFIGGPNPGEGNLISGNGTGIFQEGYPLQIWGNYIGTDITGSRALVPPSQAGVGVALLGGGNLGGPGQGDGNVISGNGTAVTISRDSYNVVQGNIIGTDATGQVAIGNAGGIVISSNGNAISGNTIAFSGTGVDVESGTGNSILGNSIHDNGTLGISLNSANNANDNQAAPVLTAAVVSPTGTTIQGTLAGVPGASFRLEFFANAGLDPSRNAEGQTYLGFATVAFDASGNPSSPDGSATVSVDGSGLATFTAAGLPALPAGQSYLTATLTNLGTGDTSEFSQHNLATNRAPSASAGGPYAVSYGGGLTLDASASSDADGDALTYAWTINGQANAVTGAQPTLSWASIASLGLVPGQSYAVSVTVNDGHGYAVTSASTTITVNKADAAITINPYSGTYDGRAHGLTGTATGALGEDLSSLLNLGPEFIDAPGGTASWSFAGNADYNAANGTGSVAIAKAKQTITWAVPAPILYGAALSGSQLDATVSVVGPAPAGGLTYSPVAGTILAPGFQTLTVTASATNDYNAATASVALQVEYQFSGFLAPLNADLAFGLGRTVPIKFQLTDYKGNFITSLSAVTLLQVFSHQAGILPLTNPRYDPTSNQFVANWQTKGLPAGIYTVQLFLADGTTQTKTLQLTANGNGANAQAADGSDVSAGSTAGQLLGGDVAVYVDNGNGALTPDELARIRDAITAVDAVTAPYGVTVEETTDPSQAEATLDMAGTSPVGGAADGILGCFDPAAGQITLLQGWDWYAGSDPTQVGPGQYDFQTTVTHELGHALGLGESDNPASAMDGTLAPGTAVRALTTADLNLPYDETGADAQRAAPVAMRPTGIGPATAQGVAQGGTELIGVPATTPRLPVSVAQASPRSQGMLRLAEPSGQRIGGKEGEGHALPAASAAPAARPVIPASPGGRLQTVVVADVTRGKQSPAGGAGDADTVPGADPRGLVVVRAADPRPDIAAADAYFRTLSLRGGALRLPAPADPARALGLGGGRDVVDGAGQAAQGLAAGSPLAVLLGALWGGQAEQPESSKRRGRRKEYPRDR